jgi:uncharacterized membrane protein (UPF0136 family)
MSMAPVRDESVIEFTTRAVIAGIFFGILFGAANAYLGLKVGLTVSTSIPIAVLTVALFKLMPSRRDGMILEANISQTIGSASSSLATGTIFTIPALFLWGMAPPFWQVRRSTTAMFSALRSDGSSQGKKSASSHVKRWPSSSEDGKHRLNPEFIGYSRKTLTRPSRSSDRQARRSWNHWKKSRGDCGSSPSRTWTETASIFTVTDVWNALTALATPPAQATRS